MSKCLLDPVWGRVIVKHLPIEESEETFKNSKIVMPDSVKEKEQKAQIRAELIAISPESFPDNIWTRKPKVGDTVVIDRYVGYAIKSKGIEYLIINDDQVVAIDREERS